MIELLIVVALMLIMATIANPNLAKARIAANESSVLGTLRTMNTAAVTYRAGYPPTFVGLAARLRVPAPRLTCSTRPSSQLGIRAASRSLTPVRTPLPAAAPVCAA